MNISTTIIFKQIIQHDEITDEKQLSLKIFRHTFHKNLTEFSSYSIQYMFSQPCDPFLAHPCRMVLNCVNMLRFTHTHHHRDANWGLDGCGKGVCCPSRFTNLFLASEGKRRERETKNAPFFPRISSLCS